MHKQQLKTTFSSNEFSLFLSYSGSGGSGLAETLTPLMMERNCLG